MGGLPCIRDLRVTVSMVLGQLAGGRTMDDVLTDYPTRGSTCAGSRRCTASSRTRNS